MEPLHCSHCQEEIQRRSQNPNQEYCSERDCQNARKRRCNAKRRKDPLYREAQRLAQEKWRRENPDYMPNYRKDHPEYVKKNRQQQRLRNCRRGLEKEETYGGSTGDVEAVIVKSNAWEGLGENGWIQKIVDPSGTMIVKSNASNPLVPVFLLPMSMIREIVKVTREDGSD